MPPEGYPTPEAAALASYSAAAQARVVRVEGVGSDRVDVIIDTEPSHPCAFIVASWTGPGASTATSLSSASLPIGART